MTLPISSKFLSSGCIWSISENDFLIGSEISLSNQRGLNAQGCLFAPDFFLSEKNSYLTPKTITQLTRTELIECLKELESSIDPFEDSLTWHGIDTNRFSEDFSSIQNMIASGEVEKIVITGFDRSDQKVSPGLIRQWLLKLLHSYTDNHFIYGAWGENGGILGATPEVLFEISNDDHLLRTVALAGTRNLHHGSSDLTLDKKETHEHDLVILGIRKALSPLEIMVGTTTELVLKRSSHLHTPISCKSDKPWNAQELIQKLHPTPALGAYPRDPGIEWLQTHNHLGDGYPRNGRSRFGAPITWLNGTDSDLELVNARCLVAIRNVQWSQDEIFIGAGCGIVKQSMLERELSELEVKIATVKEWVGS